MRWREGKSQPRPRKGNEVIKDTFPDLEGKLPNKIVEGIKAEKRIITALMGVVAKDKGLSERAHYSLYPIFWRYRDLLPDEEATRERLREMREGYEKLKEQGGAILKVQK